MAQAGADRLAVSLALVGAVVAFVVLVGATLIIVSATLQEIDETRGVVFSATRDRAAAALVEKDARYGVVKIKAEPLPTGGGFEFVNDIFGGAIPKNYIPAIEKGIKDAAARGYLAGFPVVDFRVILYDGSYHDVDSNEMSFKMAARIAMSEGMPKCEGGAFRISDRPGHGIGLTADAEKKYRLS